MGSKGKVGLQPCQCILKLLINTSNRCGCHSCGVRQQATSNLEVDRFSGTSDQTMGLSDSDSVTPYVRNHLFSFVF